MGTSFWQIASLLLAVVQMGLYLAAIEKYKDRLEDLAEDLCDLADTEAMKYMEFRDMDPDFYDYYKTLPDYEICDSNVKRSKGAAWFEYGANVRRRFQSNRGYQSSAKVHWNNYHAQNAVYAAAVHKTTTMIRERDRVNDHVLERWAAIINAPVGVERYAASSVNQIITSQLNSLRQFGRGFNSAGAAFGTALYGVLS